MGLDIAGFGAIADTAKGLIDRFFPNKTEAQKAELAQAMLLLQGEIDSQKAQIEVNKAEATNPSVFVSGWRPFIGWVCG